MEAKPATPVPTDKEELTAEWTVHAQLKLVRPSDVKRCQSLGRVQSPRDELGSPRGDDGNNTKTFVYKWRSDCPDKAITDTFNTSKVGICRTSAVKWSHFLLNLTVGCKS